MCKNKTNINLQAQLIERIWQLWTIWEDSSMHRSAILGMLRQLPSLRSTLATLVNLLKVTLWLWVWYWFTTSTTPKRKLEICSTWLTTAFSKRYSKTCVVHFVGTGKIRNKAGTIAGLFNHLFTLVDKEPGRTTVISHLRTTPSIFYGRTIGLATLILQVHQCFSSVIGRKRSRIFLIVEKNKGELVGPKGFYPKREFKEYIPTQNKPDQMISKYVEECQDERHLLLLNNVFSTSHEANPYKEMKKVADVAQARVYPKGDGYFLEKGKEN